MMYSGSSRWEIPKLLLGREAGNIDIAVARNFDHRRNSKWVNLEKAVYIQKDVFNKQCSLSVKCLRDTARYISIDKMVRKTITKKDKAYNKGHQE